MALRPTAAQGRAANLQPLALARQDRGEQPGGGLRRAEHRLGALLDTAVRDLELSGPARARLSGLSVPYRFHRISILYGALCERAGRF